MSPLPGTRSRGRTTGVDGRYAGDGRRFAIDPANDPQAMVGCGGIGAALLCRAVAIAGRRVFHEVIPGIGIRRFGAPAHAWNAAWRRVLERDGFALAGTFAEEGAARCFQRNEI